MSNSELETKIPAKIIFIKRTKNFIGIMDLIENVL